jgi:predicted anti-sigma-YlaC factor YlaD
MNRCYEEKMIISYIKDTMNNEEREHFQLHMESCEKCFNSYLELLEENLLDFNIDIADKVIEKTIIKDKVNIENKRNHFYNKVICYVAACIVILLVYTVNIQWVVDLSTIETSVKTNEKVEKNRLAQSYKKIGDLIDFGREENNEEEK